MEKNLEILTNTLLPLSLHGINPRTIMGEEKWNQIKKEKQQIANHHCMCCGEYVPHIKGNYLECHEVYKVDKINRQFELVDFVCICNKCHRYIHRGFLQMQVLEGNFTKKYYDEIIRRGDNLLKEANLNKKDLPKKEIHNPSWTLLYEGKIYKNDAKTQK